MSRRAASSGGFCAESANVARIRYGSAPPAPAGEDRRREQDRRHARSDRAHGDPRVEIAVLEEAVAESAACEDAADRAAADDEQQQVRERLRDAVLVHREL